MLDWGRDWSTSDVMIRDYANLANANLTLDAKTSGVFCLVELL